MHDADVYGRHMLVAPDLSVQITLNGHCTCIWLLRSLFSSGRASSYTKAYCFLNWSVLNLPLRFSNLGSLLSLQVRREQSVCVPRIFGTQPRQNT